MPETKYTKDGKKVAVIGKLNNTEWIVQEIFVSNGQEFPGGENFVVTSLLDELAETWQEKKDGEKQANTERSVKELNVTLSRLRKEKTQLRMDIDLSKLINKVKEKYTDVDIEQFDSLFAFMSGSITHLVIPDWNSVYKIETFPEAIKGLDDDKFNGLRLISLFGCNKYGERYKNDSLSLDWRINRWRDDSGNWTKIYPCKSYEEAVGIVDSLIIKNDTTEKLIQLKKKYGLKNPTEEKIKVFKNKFIENKKEAIQKAKENVEQLEATLEEMEKE